MDLNDIRSLVTMASFVFFLALVAWTWRPSRHAGLDLAAQLPFLGEAGFGGRGKGDE
jgi:cbb3-type cytochrome oxidase subunit 3